MTNADAGSTTLVLRPLVPAVAVLRGDPARAGCSAYDIYNHMYLPAYYDDPVTEYWALLSGVTIWDVGVERIVQIKGPDAMALHEPAHVPRTSRRARSDRASTC